MSFVARGSYWRKIDRWQLSTVAYPYAFSWFSKSSFFIMTRWISHFEVLINKFEVVEHHSIAAFCKMFQALEILRTKKSVNCKFFRFFLRIKHNILRNWEKSMLVLAGCLAPLIHSSEMTHFEVTYIGRKVNGVKKGTPFCWGVFETHKSSLFLWILNSL